MQMYHLQLHASIVHCMYTQSWFWKAADPSVGIWSWVAQYDDSADLRVVALSGSLLKAHS